MRDAHLKKIEENLQDLQKRFDEKVEDNDERITDKNQRMTQFYVYKQNEILSLIKIFLVCKKTIMGSEDRFE